MTAEIPPYQRIAKEIRDQIVAGVYAPGDRIPSTRELVDREGVAKATVDKVMRVLKEDHLVESKPGVGLVVRGWSAVLRRLQTGSVRAYAMSFFLGVVAIVGYYLWR